MKSIFVAINAKYIHTNPAVRTLSLSCQSAGFDAEFLEFTINQPLEYIQKELFLNKPDLLCFSCYIWNIVQVKFLVKQLQIILPNCKICLGGPEVSYNAKDVLLSCPADFVVRGEGEEAMPLLLKAIEEHLPLTTVANLTFRQKDEIITTPSSSPPELTSIPFPYPNLKASCNHHQIYYYESSRGCPFRCSYCLSSAEDGVRFLPLSRVFADLSCFLEAKVPQVKFVDRSFHCNRKRANQIWHYLAQNDNQVTNFHFEINAETLTEDDISFLKSVRPGLFQFEIGVQSTNSDTLHAVGRTDSFSKIKQTVRSLQKANNIHLHLDLIAGLPLEDYQSFGRSFNDVFSLRPQQLQLGFLKLLHGSQLEAKRDFFQLKASPEPPYEILTTPALSHQDLLRLKSIERMVERYYNSNRFCNTIEYLLSFFPSPFSFFERLGTLCDEQQLDILPQRKEEQYTLLYRLAKEQQNLDSELFFWLVKLDLYSHEKVKKAPDWLTVSITKKYQTAIYAFFNQKENITKYLPEYQDLTGVQIYRNAHIEVFPFDPITKEQTDTALLFNYRKRTFSGKATICTLPQITKSADR